MTDVLFGLGLLRHLLVLPLLARLLELPVPGREGGSGRGEVVLVLHSTFQGILPPGTSFKVIRSKFLLSLAFSDVRLDVVMNL